MYVVLKLQILLLSSCITSYSSSLVIAHSSYGVLIFFLNTSSGKKNLTFFSDMLQQCYVVGFLCVRVLFVFWSLAYHLQLWKTKAL